jgi:hypothetical protein
MCAPDEDRGCKVGQVTVPGGVDKFAVVVRNLLVSRYYGDLLLFNY